MLGNTRRCLAANVAVLPVLAVMLVTPAIAQPNEPFELRDGDRVVLLGGTYIERMQSHGYFETLLTAAYPNRNITFRNLGWSGDDISGIARAVFGQPTDGFQRLRKDVFEAKPTVIMVAYGANEANLGKPGLPHFIEGYKRLLDTLAETEARLVLVSPSHREHLGRPLPNPKSYNQDLRAYADAIGELARERNHHFVDFYRPLGDSSGDVSQPPAIRNQLTDNGLHFNAYGHWRTAALLASALNAPDSRWQVSINVADASYDVVGPMVADVEIKTTSVKFSAIDPRLPQLPPPEFSPRGARLVAPHGIVRIAGLAPGNYGLQIDGKPTIMANEKSWASGVYVNLGEYDEQTEKLRQTIGEKNKLYFHRYRPQNETYLFLFRKHEQGNNAIEIPQFDPLIAEKEKLIAELRRPKAKTYRLVQLKTEEADDEQ